MIGPLARAFALARWRVWADWVLGAGFIVAPTLALEVLGAPNDPYTAAFASLFGGSVVFKGFVHRALLMSSGRTHSSLMLAMWVFEALLAVLLGLVVFRGPEVGPMVAGAAGFFGVEALLDAVAYARCVHEGAESERTGR